MTAHMIAVLANTEIRLRMRRWSTVFALLAMVVLGWAVAGNPVEGTTMLSANEARVLYTSSALSMGSAALFGLVFVLMGFYLVRGRMGEDLRSGMGGVIAATQVGNAAFLWGRWLGGVAYLLALAMAFLGAVAVLHGVHGDGAFQIGVYLQTYALLLVPMVFFVVSCALLFDAIPTLMGKRGDVLYFFVWVGQIAMLAQVSEMAQSHLNGTMLLDFSGIVIAEYALVSHLGTTHVNLGLSSFDTTLTPLLLPAQLWLPSMVYMRLGSGLLALSPMLPAVMLFHRFSPDRVKASMGRRRRTPLAFLNTSLRPLSRLVQPLFSLAGRVPGRLGQALGDVALTLVISPVAVLVLLIATVASLVCGVKDLGGLLIPVVAFWGILICDMATRDGTANTESLTGAVPGGVTERYLRTLLATTLLGLMFTGVIALRWARHAPLQAAALLAGLLCLGALATLLGRCSKTAKTFLSLYLFALYVALNVREVPWLDLVGFNGVATVASISTTLVVAVLATGLGYVCNRRQAH